MDVNLLREFVTELTREYKDLEQKYVSALSVEQIKCKQDLEQHEQDDANTAEWYNALIEKRKNFNVSLSPTQRALRRELKNTEARLKEHKLIFSFEKSTNILKDLIYQDT
jgi:hypothetical protein